jgi:hypothetical protein
MSTIISTVGSGTTDISATSFTITGVAAQAGDMIILHVDHKAVSTAGAFTGTISWNNQRLVPLLSIGVAGSTKSHMATWAVTAISTGSYDITVTKATAHNFSYLCHVVRPTKGFLGLPTLKTSVFDSAVAGSLGAYASPSITSDALNVNDRIIDFLNTTGLSGSNADSRPTTATPTNSTTIGSTSHTNQGVNTLDSSTATGTGALTTGYTHTYNASNAPCYYYTQLLLREVVGDISFLSSGPLVHAGNNISSSITATAPRDAKKLLIFISADAAITASVSTMNSVTVNGAAATLITSSPVNADGIGQLHWVYEFNNIVPGVSYVISENHPLNVHHCIFAFVQCKKPIVTTIGAYSRANNTTPSCTMASEVGDLTFFGIGYNNLGTDQVSQIENQLSGEYGDVSFWYHGVTVKEATTTTQTANWTGASAQRWCAVAINMHKVPQANDNILISGWKKNTASPFWDGAALDGGH